MSEKYESTAGRQFKKVRKLREQLGTYRRLLHRSKEMAENVGRILDDNEKELAVLRAKVSVLNVFDRMTSMIHGNHMSGMGYHVNARANLEILQREIIAAFKNEELADDSERADDNGDHRAKPDDDDHPLAD